MSESDKCDCKGVKAGKKMKDSGCPETRKDDSNKCCGPLPKKEEKPKCSGASACAQSQKCSGKSDFGKDKSICPGKEEQKCHSSQEQFKKSQDRCPSDVKCSKSYTAFLESREESACPRKDGKCHESYTAFFSKKDSDNSPCSAMAAPKQKNEPYCPCPTKTESESPCGTAYRKAFQQQKDPCSKPKSESPCSSAYKKALEQQKGPCSKPKSESPCSSAYEKSLKQQKKDLMKQKDPCSRPQKTPPVQKPCTLETEKTTCYSSSKKSTRSEKSCGSQVGDSKGASAYAKLSGYCKNLAKKYVSPKTKSKCSGDVQLTKQICPVRPSKLPPSKPPCPPMTEFGIPSQAGVDCTSKVTCPQMKKSDPSAFFPLDARNKELNDCIEKWTKMDPNQVIGKCSQFADKPGRTLCQKCLDAVKKTSHCPSTSRKGMAKRPNLMVPAKARQLASRWTPSAVGYIATSALLTIYVTEWKAILRHVPFYSSKIAEEEMASQ